MSETMLGVQPAEQVDHPAHYNVGSIEVIDAIDDWKLGFSLGNAVKYIARAGHKDDAVQDLKKAVWYIEHEIASLTDAQEGANANDNG